MQQQQQRKLPGYYIKSSIYKPEKMKKEQKDFSYIYEPHAIEDLLIILIKYTILFVMWVLNQKTATIL